MGNEMTAAPSSPTVTPPGSLEPDDVVRLRLALARLARQQRRVDPTGLTPSQQSALAVIDRDGPLPLGEVARLENVAPPTITRIVTKLEQQGLVARTPDPSDGRRALVSLTDTGRQRMQETRERRNQWLAAKLAALGPDDVADLRRLIDPLERLVSARPLAEPEGAPTRRPRP